MLHEQDYNKKYEIIIHEYGSILNAILNSNGCHYVQLMLDNISNNDAYKLIREIHGNVQIIIKSSHGNYVIQKMINVLPPSMCLFMIDEIYDDIFEIVCNKYGCRVVLRLVEHLTYELKASAMFEKILQKPMMMCNHLYGHYFIEGIIEHGLTIHKEMIINAIYIYITEIINGKKNIIHIHYVSIIEYILMYCKPIEKEKLVKLMKDNIEIIQNILRKDKFITRYLNSIN
tara:strand:- start:4365 stop:5054 length:690 start_codon:yes stop_codon:yes gene_type:complete